MPSLTTVITHATGDVFPAADWNTYLRDNLNYLITAGTALATAATITPTNEYQLLTGSVTVTNITAGTKDGQEVLFLVRDGTTIQHNGGGTGNIRLAGATDAAMPARSAIMLLWDATTNVWQEIARVGAGGSATVATTVAGLGTGIAGKLGVLRLPPSTYNNGGALALPAGIITVGDTAEFAAAGTLTTANGTITYTGKTATTFTGCTGGVGTLAANAALTQGTGTPINSSWEIVGLIYDAVLGKWVSPAETLIPNGTVNPTTTSLTFAELFINAISGPAVKWRAYDAAGLKPQLRLVGTAINNTGATTLIVCPSFDGTNGNVQVANGPRNHNGGDANAAGPAVPLGGTFTANFVAPFYTLWGNIPGGYTLYDYFQPGAQMKVSGGTGQLSSYQWELRWVG